MNGYIYINRRRGREIFSEKKKKTAINIFSAALKNCLEIKQAINTFSATLKNCPEIEQAINTFSATLKNCLEIEQAINIISAALEECHEIEQKGHLTGKVCIRSFSLHLLRG